MDNRLDEIELVKKAQRGDRQSLNRIAELSKERLRVFVWRLTLQEDTTQEIVQETLLEMVKILGKLKRADRFWPWLYGIATNKLHRHRRAAARFSHDSRVPGPSRAGSSDLRMGHTPQGASVTGHENRGFEDLVSEELREIVSAAMHKLKTRHRAVLVMRCYDEMSYAEIAESMSCTEFGTRMLFLRAKKALQKELLRNGFSKGSLLAALTLFGKMTAPSEAAAAKVAVTATATNVGFLAGLAGLATTKTAIISFAAAGALTVGVYSEFVFNGPEQAGHGIVGVEQQAAEEYWYYFPDGPAGAMMMRARAGSNGDRASWQVLQNDRGNYRYQNNTMYINNHRMWASDLSVLTVPTDSSELTAFLCEIGGGESASGGQHVTAKGRGLLVVASRNKDRDAAARLGEGANRSGEGGRGSGFATWVIRHFNVLDEDYFQSDWPTGVSTIDNCDSMHRRGWTWFRIDGFLNGQQIKGVGQMPFVYAAARRYSPWLKLRVGDEAAFNAVSGGLTLADTGQEATAVGPDGMVVKSFQGGAFFKGLARPWMGFHTIDTVRRDAAEQRLRFQTTPSPDGKAAEIAIDAGQVRLIYTVNMETDVVDKITFYLGDRNVGQLQFSYVQEITGLGSEFSRSQVQVHSSLGRSRDKEIGLLWLVRLAEGSLGK
jgi:RNA polymerase sigma-70 factor (ECF subfamily)